MAAADWDEIARLAVPAPTGVGTISPATAVIFDDIQELVWIGTNEGRLVSYSGPDLQRYTSAKAHINEGPIKQLLSHDRGILSISNRGVHLTSRKGPALWHIDNPQTSDIRCMCFTNNPNHVLVAGLQPVLFIVDIDKGIVVSQIVSQANYTILKKGRQICAATDDGHVHILSLTDFSILKVWKAHPAAVNDMDTRSDFLVTCGFSVRHLTMPMVDPLAKVYDLKNLISLPPIPFHAGAAYIRLHPKLQTTSFVASQTGQMQVVDIMNPANIVLKQANVNFMLGFEISSSGDILIISDSNGLMYLWGSPQKARFNNMSKETEFASPTPQQTAHVDWEDSPLNAIPMPFYNERLLSAWPSHMIHEIGAPPASIDPTIIPFLQPADLGYAAQYSNPRKIHRNQIENTRFNLSAASMAQPKFLSEKAREALPEDAASLTTGTAQALAGMVLNGRAQTEEERMLKYSKVEIKYSRFGVDDFDFSFYNKTTFSGLETHISNSFVNALLQLYRFVPLIRNVALHHAATGCVAGGCLLCEFGFLFDMLEKATGQNCQATNLLRAFSASKEAANLGLFESSAAANGQPLSLVIQSVNRYFLKQMAHDYSTMHGTSDGLDEILGIKSVEAIRCMTCGNDTTKHNTAYLHDLTYPLIDPKHHRPHMIRFSNVLKASIERETKSKAWCTKCRRYQQLAIRKTIQQLPYVLMINAAIVNPNARAIWETPGWLPAEIGLIVQDRVIHCFEGSDLNLHLRNKTAGLMVYELVGFVADIDVDERQPPHLVGMVNVDVSSAQPTPSPTQKAFPNWHLFNDFLVSAIEPREALHFNKGWKLPSIICYQIKSAHGKIDESWKSKLQTSLLHEPYSVNGIEANARYLGSDEVPQAGQPIALDTEFVELEKAEIDVKADGSQETIRPAKSGLARVSVLRGEGSSAEVPFVDDYIMTIDSIVDYKTQYSGIHPGDLDPALSRHNLVPLKVAYKKLWLLLNMGCIFVGHGLASDFRKVNIHVPKAQTIDTQYLYLAPGKNRRLSLRYLAWAVFNEYIQEESFDDKPVDGHDSIEDARMALRLWRKFQEYEERGIVEQMIEDIYRKGSRYGWKPPLRSGGGSLLADGMMQGGVNSTFASGRNTPEIGVGGSPLPGTPRNSGTSFRMSATGIEFVPGISSGTRDSPLR